MTHASTPDNPLIDAARGRDPAPHTSTEQERAEFEAWALKEPKWRHARTPEWMLLKKEDGEYAHLDVQYSWESWQAARRAQVVPQWVVDGVHNALTFAEEDSTQLALGALRKLHERIAAAPQPPEAACNPSLQPELATQPSEPKGWREALQAVCMDMVAVGSGQHVISDEARAKVEVLQAELFQKAAPANQAALTESEAAALAAVYLPVSRQADGVALIRAMAQKFFAIPAAESESWKDHNTAELVNNLTTTARTYCDTQQLRERIASVVRPLAERLKAANK